MVTPTSPTIESKSSFVSSGESPVAFALRAVVATMALFIFTGGIIAGNVEKNYALYDGFIIAHGTNIMAGEINIDGKIY